MHSSRQLSPTPTTQTRKRHMTPTFLSKTLLIKLRKPSSLARRQDPFTPHSKLWSMNITCSIEQVFLKMSAKRGKKTFASAHGPLWTQNLVMVNPTTATGAGYHNATAANNATADDYRRGHAKALIKLASATESYHLLSLTSLAQIAHSPSSLQ